MARSFESLSDALAAALRAVQPGECVNYLRSCGYCQE
jgi:hypothetical protein